MQPPRNQDANRLVSRVRGSVSRYTGSYEVQVHVGRTFGPGYATAPVAVDVPQALWAMSFAVVLLH
jgi:hypothetical protein